MWRDDTPLAAHVTSTGVNPVSSTVTATDRVTHHKHKQRRQGQSTAHDPASLSVGPTPTHTLFNRIPLARSAGTRRERRNLLDDVVWHDASTHLRSSVSVSKHPSRSQQLTSDVSYKAHEKTVLDMLRRRAAFAFAWTSIIWACIIWDRMPLPLKAPKAPRFSVTWRSRAHCGR